MTDPLTHRRPLQRIEDAVVDTAGYLVLQAVPPVVLATVIRMECRRRRRRAARRA